MGALIVLAELLFICLIYTLIKKVFKPYFFVALNHSVISPLCLVWVRAPPWPRETSQVLLAGVSGVFSRGSPVFAPPTDWSVAYELK